MSRANYCNSFVAIVREVVGRQKQKIGIAEQESNLPDNTGT